MDDIIISTDGDPVEVEVCRYPLWSPVEELAGSSTVEIQVLDPDKNFDVYLAVELTVEDALALAARLLDAVREIGSEPEKVPTPCVDCGIELTPDTPPESLDWQWYMVYDTIWAAAGMEKNGGCLCIPCLEKRLGRELTGSDLPDLPINKPSFCGDTPRLAELKRDSGAKAAG